jgi:hypothetical protein
MVMNRLRFTGALPATAFSALVICASSPVRLVLVVDDLVAPGVGRAGGPGLGEYLPVGHLGTRVIRAPFLDDVGDLRELRTEDERQPRSLDRVPVRLRQHPGVGHDRDVGEPVRRHERGDRGDHRRGLGLVALERLHHQREPGRVGEQPDGDLRIQPAFLGEPGLPEPIPLIGLEIQRRHVV